MLLSDLRPCLKGAAVVAQPELREYLVSLRSLISAPADVYAELYLTTLYAFAELCQSMPFVTNPKAYGFIDQQLHILIAALKLRRGKMLPLHAESESIAEQEPLWTYALFSAGLLWQLSYIQDHYSVDLYKNKSEKLGSWHPVAGSLGEENTHYQILQKPPAFVLEQTQFQIFMAGKIMPTVGLRWLAEHSTIFKVWWEAVTYQAQPDNVLITLLETATQRMNLSGQQAATEKSVESDSHVTSDEKELISETENISISPVDILEKITTWLLYQIEIKTTSAEKGLPSFFKLTQGFFISRFALEAFIAQQSLLKNMDFLLEALNEALEKKPSTDSIETSQKTLFFRYRSTHFENRTVLEGIVISEQYLSAALKAVPPQKDVMSDFKP